MGWKSHWGLNLSGLLGITLILGRICGRVQCDTGTRVLAGPQETLCCVNCSRIVHDVGLLPRTRGILMAMRKLITLIRWD
jgi:hypothetical protein